MRHGRKPRLLILLCTLILGVGLVDVAPSAAAGSSTPATAPGQLTNAYPLGTRTLDRGGSGASSGHSGTQPAATRPQQPAQSAGRAAGSTRNGGSSGWIWIVVVGVVAVLVGAGATELYRRLRVPDRAGKRAAKSAPATPADPSATSTPPTPAERSATSAPATPPQATAQHAPDAAGSAIAAANGRSDAAPAVGMEASADPGPTQPRKRAVNEGEPVEATPAARAPARRRAQEAGNGKEAFDLGVQLHERGDFAGAMRAYRQAEENGDPDAGFNLGVLLYETGDLDGAEAAFRRSAQRGHVRAGTNLKVLQERRRARLDPDRPPPTKTPPSRGRTEPVSASMRAAAAPESPELTHRSGDEGASASDSFNLGVLLHKRRDFPGAKRAYLRAEQSGDPDAAFNLGVLLYENGDLDGAEAAFRRCAERGHPRAAANLKALLRRRRNVPS